MRGKIKYITLGVILLLVAMLGVIIIRNRATGKLNTNEDTWAIYTGPTYTRFVYGNKNFNLIQFDESGNIQKYKHDGYMFSELLNYKDKVIYQNSKGVTSIDNSITDSHIISDENTIGYGKSGILKDEDLFYFLLNGELKSGYYSSYLILGNENNQTLHEIEGFIEGYGDDGKNIYLLTADKDRYSLQIQRLNIEEQEKFTVESNHFTFDTVFSTDSKMIIEGDYIYCLCNKDGAGRSIFKIHKDTLELESIEDVILFDSSDDSNEYSVLNSSSIFLKNSKIYYPVISGKVYSFNINTSEFKEEFMIENYKFKSDTHLLGYYNEADSEIDFMYYEYSAKKYCISTYSLDGTLKDKFYLNNLKLKSGQYVHTFIKTK